MNGDCLLASGAHGELREDEPMSCRSLLFVAALSVAGVGVTAQVTVVPTDIQTPGTQPGEVTNLQTPDKCDNCHGGYDAAVEPAHNWAGGMMANATRDPLYWATVAVAEQDFPGAGDLCIRCHTPEGWLEGRSTPTDGSGLGVHDFEGVTCDACHRMTNPDTSEPQDGVQNAPFLAHDEQPTPTGYYGSGMIVAWPASNEKLGPYEDADANHGFFLSRFHRSASFCGTCHDVSNPAVGDLAPGHGAMAPLPGGFNGTPGGTLEEKAAFNNFPYAYGAVERTFSEHQGSAFATLSVADYDSLPAELQDGSIQRAWQAAMASSPDGNYLDGWPRTFTCQTCHMLPVTGAGCDKAGAPIRADLPLHDLTGGNSWLPEVLAYMDDLGQLVGGGGLTGGQLASLADARDRALVMLGDAAALAVEGDTVRVVNLTGHKLISGYPEGRRMWLSVRWFDGQGGLLRVDGDYGMITVDIEGTPTQVETLLDPQDPETRIYEAHFAVSQEWASALLGLGYSPSLPLSFDRVTGAVTKTLGDAAGQQPGTHVESFHFVLNDLLVSDNRIPPYGFRHDDALARSTLPVPADQYGDPGAGGVYEHFDLLDLHPPVGAATASIELLYQTTSWEYIQFLHLANDGTAGQLASTGDDLLRAWLATGMAAPVVMASASWTSAGGGGPPLVDVPFDTRLRGIHTDPSGPLGQPAPGPGPLDGAQASTATADDDGSSGSPRLVAPGSVGHDGTLTLELSAATPGAHVLLRVGLADRRAPLASLRDRETSGSRVVTLGPWPVDADGRARITLPVPPGMDGRHVAVVTAHVHAGQGDAPSVSNPVAFRLR